MLWHLLERSQRWNLMSRQMPRGAQQMLPLMPRLALPLRTRLLLQKAQNHRQKNHRQIPHRLTRYQQVSVSLRRHYENRAALHCDTSVRGVVAQATFQKSCCGCPLPLCWWQWDPRLVLPDLRRLAPPADGRTLATVAEICRCRRQVPLSFRFLLPLATPSAQVRALPKSTTGARSP